MVSCLYLIRNQAVKFCSKCYKLCCCSGAGVIKSSDFDESAGCSMKYSLC